jgi:hypothetical protein
MVVKRDTIWNAYKVHLSGTCDAEKDTSRQGDRAGGRPEPCLRAAAGSGHGETVAAAAQPDHECGHHRRDRADSAMTGPIHHALARRGLLRPCPVRDH